jgi:hypothetical protein
MCESVVLSVFANFFEGGSKSKNNNKPATKPASGDSKPKQTRKPTQTRRRKPGQGMYQLCVFCYIYVAVAT